ncbi:hypothetical protein BMR96_11085 [Leuconostoc pseudomesenteroides]|uniref:Formate--tetrahydrofolate ligase n=1 Tax=Leuconostoc pseudomesenteroides TaxID=33968 RepID=A0A1X0VAK0_LEUPS|nr:hypothetical protein BMR96_11085 [Leuconostoc pseudomesenteroides]
MEEEEGKRKEKEYSELGEENKKQKKEDEKKLGENKEFKIQISECVPKKGDGFLVALTGNIMTMPGLPKHPAALDIDIDENGIITGLF